MKTPAMSTPVKSTPVSAIPNLGPAAAAACARAGIASAEALRALGADAAYRRLVDSGEPAHFIGYYALVMGLQGRPWTDCRGDEKAALRLRFDRIKADAAAAVTADSKKGRAELEAALDALGLRAGPGTLPARSGLADPTKGSVPKDQAARQASGGQPTSSRPEK